MEKLASLGAFNQLFLAPPSYAIFAGATTLTCITSLPMPIWGAPLARDPLHGVGHPMMVVKSSSLPKPTEHRSLK
jgi:hypothetical protein